VFAAHPTMQFTSPSNSRRFCAEVSSTKGNVPVSWLKRRSRISEGNERTKQLMRSLYHVEPIAPLGELQNEPKFDSRPSSLGTVPTRLLYTSDRLTVKVQKTTSGMSGMDVDSNRAVNLCHVPKCNIPISVGMVPEIPFAPKSSPTTTSPSHTTEPHSHSTASGFAESSVSQASC
jgi:hypothetical protein